MCVYSEETPTWRRGKEEDSQNGSRGTDRQAPLDTVSFDDMVSFDDTVSLSVFVLGYRQSHSSHADRFKMLSV